MPPSPFLPAHAGVWAARAHTPALAPQPCTRALAPYVVSLWTCALAGGRAGPIPLRSLWANLRVDLWARSSSTPLRDQCVIIDAVRRGAWGWHDGNAGMLGGSTRARRACRRHACPASRRATRANDLGDGKERAPQGERRSEVRGTAAQGREGERCRAASGERHSHQLPQGESLRSLGV